MTIGDTVKFLVSGKMETGTIIEVNKDDTCLVLHNNQIYRVYNECLEVI